MMNNTKDIRKILQRRVRKINVNALIMKIIFGSIFILFCFSCLEFCQLINSVDNLSKKCDQLLSRESEIFPTMIRGDEYNIYPIETTFLKIDETDITSGNNTLTTDTSSIIEEKHTFPDKFDNIPLDDDVKEYIYTSAVEAGIPPEILFSIASKESTYNPDAKSATRDHGLFQINECNFERLANHFGYNYNDLCKKLIYDPYINTDFAIYIIAECKDNYSNDNWHHVLMRYNMGPSGAEKCFKNGIYSSNYSRSIISIATDTFGLSDITIS